MRFRKLRIAWSVGWGIVALYLCVLWARSYWWSDGMTIAITSTNVLGFGSVQGEITAARIEPPSQVVFDRYQIVSEPIDRQKPLYRPESMPGYQGAAGFGISHAPLFFAICTPDWFLTALAGAFGVAPWIWLPSRFSLRTLLIATTLVALVMGLVVWLW